MASTPVDNDKLMPWYYAVNWAGMMLEQHITQIEEIGLDSTTHKERLAQLEDLKQFLSMSWDVWMLSIAKNAEVFQ
jgi:hypothetical protein